MEGLTPAEREEAERLAAIAAEAERRAAARAAARALGLAPPAPAAAAPAPAPVPAARPLVAPGASLLPAPSAAPLAASTSSTTPLAALSREEREKLALQRLAARRAAAATQAPTPALQQPQQLQAPPAVPAPAPRARSRSREREYAPRGAAAPAPDASAAASSNTSGGGRDRLGRSLLPAWATAASAPGGGNGGGNGSAAAAPAPARAGPPAGAAHGGAAARAAGAAASVSAPPRPAAAAASTPAAPPPSAAPAAKKKPGPGAFRFDWGAEDDTSTGADTLYGGGAAPALAFGRGHAGGQDERAVKAGARHYEAVVAQLRQRDAAAAIAAAGGNEELDVAGAEVAGAGGPRLAAAAAVPRGSAAAAALAPRRPYDDVDADPVSTLHWSEKPLSAMSDRDWRIMREDFDIVVKGGRAALPLRSWEEASLHPAVRKGIAEAGYKAPTPIQRAAVPMGLAGRDLIGIAETGSGKTAAFLIPLLSWVLQQPAAARAAAGEAGPLALVLAPTRELATQIEEECRKLARFSDLRSAVIVGGTAIEVQGLIIRRGVDVLISTPGRLIDMLDNGYAVLGQCSYLVLDEADRMIDLGFEPQVQRILEAMAPAPAASTERGRTTHMFTATMPPIVEKLCKVYFKDPATVKIGDKDSGKNRRIAQEIIVLKEGQKRSKLLDVLRRAARPVIVFINLKKTCDAVAKDLEGAGMAVGVLHSGKTQDARTDSLAAFKAGQCDILLATDVAGRGLDIPDVAHVVNFDMASDIDRYTHRIGRTGRAGKSGRSTTFITDDDAAVIPALKSYLEATGQPVPHELAARAAAADDFDAREIRL